MLYVEFESTAIRVDYLTGLGITSTSLNSVSISIFQAEERLVAADAMYDFSLQPELRRLILSNSASGRMGMPRGIFVEEDMDIGQVEEIRPETGTIIRFFAKQASLGLCT
ncbi:unnamed protein product [Clonostachys rhizophaga]|uniref:Uncharacterized protein n=1 Tax=Clonostachys rhizophaga TaxID=160324 RepID=A0A9N9V3I8_9HYPO|nr:unnamed protein product [Clonostachys rhizophaga]